MTHPIDVQSLHLADGLQAAARENERAPEGKGFGSILKDLVEEADSLQKEAEGRVDGFANGQVDDVHEVMLAMTKADLSFRMMLEVRNKLVEAYQEVMRIPV